ncbi:hypothetical protein [Streptomyces sp. NBC_00470]|uniref:hypothetical protein n=1 Tax=Streptomyces sp. NBC_00470 TaxID=2975753 RepID=UPI002F907F5F
MADQTPHEPVLPAVQPVPGGLYGDQAYESALSSLRHAVAEISAALHTQTDPGRRSELLAKQASLIEMQHSLLPGDDLACAAARVRSQQVLAELAEPA